MVSAANFIEIAIDIFDVFGVEPEFKDSISNFTRNIVFWYFDKWLSIIIIMTVTLKSHVPHLNHVIPPVERNKQTDNLILSFTHNNLSHVHHIRSMPFFDVFQFDRALFKCNFCACYVCTCQCCAPIRGWSKRRTETELPSAKATTTRQLCCTFYGTTLLLDHHPPSRSTQVSNVLEAIIKTAIQF